MQRYLGALFLMSRFAPSDLEDLLPCVLPVIHSTDGLDPLKFWRTALIDVTCTTKF